MNVAFIVNPAAAHGRARRVWQRVAAALRERGYTYQAYFTAGPGHATELARQAAQRHEVIAAVGGDGTAHQVLAGLIGSGRELAVVPAGTANDYCRSAGIPLDPVAAALALNQHRVRRVDYGWVGAEPFLNVAGIGLDAAVCRALEDHWRFLPGKLGYVAAVLENLVRLRPTRV
ncbi:MAG TPA: diacylglycerol kinase family lipid kinase, partial [Firmicutes bacterium]|nr:diacylglycerol kinase family lipid kinase [Bacillota bacterium]